MTVPRSVPDGSGGASAARSWRTPRLLEGLGRAADEVRDGLLDLGLTTTQDRNELLVALQGNCPDGTAHFGILDQFARSGDDIDRTVTEIAGLLLLEFGGETTSRQRGDVVRATFDDDIRVEVDAPGGHDSLTVKTDSGCIPES